MSSLWVIEPMPIAAISASRGSGVANLLRPDPKEVWIDEQTDSQSRITIDLGGVRTIDTVFLGHLRGASVGARWTVKVSGAGDSTPQPETDLRVPDVAGNVATLSHALWTGAPVDARTVELTLQQPAGAAALTAGTIIIGRALVATLGPEWGAGRQPIDTGTATSLPSGGWSMVEGVRKRRFSWTFGDLSSDEVDRLELIAMALGETKPGLVVEDVSRTAGLVARIRYGKFDRWKAFERRNRAQTRWEVGIEDWV